jgi:hypothetical protein
MANHPDWLADALSEEGLDVVESPGWHVGRGQRDYPKAQYQADVRCAAAIVRMIGQSASHVIGDKEWSTDKTEPALDMDEFRADIEAHPSAASSVDAKGR